MSSREKRHQIIDLLLLNASKHEDNFKMYIVACIVGWYFRDSPVGMATTKQVVVYNFVHAHIDALNREFETPEINKAHHILHDLGDELIEKLKAKGMIVDGEDRLLDDEELLSRHEEDFAHWTKELEVKDEE